MCGAAELQTHLFPQNADHVLACTCFTLASCAFLGKEMFRKDVWNAFSAFWILNRILLFKFLCVSSWLAPEGMQSSKFYSDKTWCKFTFWNVKKQNTKNTKKQCMHASNSTYLDLEKGGWQCHHSSPDIIEYVLCLTFRINKNFWTSDDVLNQYCKEWCSSLQSRSGFSCWHCFLPPVVPFSVVRLFCMNLSLRPKSHFEWCVALPPSHAVSCLPPSCRSEYDLPGGLLRQHGRVHPAVGELHMWLLHDVLHRHVLQWPWVPLTLSSITNTLLI